MSARAGAGPSRPLVRRAPAKINLRLTVLAREESGYHQLETVFCALELADRIEVNPDAPGLSLEVVGARLGAARRNLAYRAATAFFRAAGLPARAAIRLTKRIPAGAGLGGGSSDAAATLLALSRLHGRPLTPARLLSIGVGLGSDVPFFLAGKTSHALAWGRGERLFPLPPPPRAPVLLAVPPFPSSTAEAYRALADDRAGSDPAPAPRLFDARRLSDWDAIARDAVNDFEPVVFARFPALAQVKQDLARAGARFALLAGSGSTVFAVFHDRSDRASAAAVLRRRFPEYRFLQTWTAGSAG